MKIVTDCAADMSAEELGALGVEQAPLHINSGRRSQFGRHQRRFVLRPHKPCGRRAYGHAVSRAVRRAVPQSQVRSAHFLLHISSG
jgi:hypothetical protein